MGEGNKAVITEYALLHQDSLYRLAYSCVRNTDDAMDVVQSALVKALSAQSTLKNPEYIRTWMYRILMHTAMDVLRRKKRLISMDQALLPETGQEDRYSDLDLGRALTDLPDAYRNVIVLRFFEDMKLEEVAEVLNENVNTVKTRLYRALELLRIEMREEEER